METKDIYNGILAFYSLEFMCISKLRNSLSYRCEKHPFFLCFKSFLQINDLIPPGVGIYEI